MIKYKGNCSLQPNNKSTNDNKSEANKNWKYSMLSDELRNNKLQYLKDEV